MKVAILGYGNIGRAAEQAIMTAPDIELAGIYHHNDNIDNIHADVVLLCTPTREVEKFAKMLLKRGICTVDSFDIHQQIYKLRQSLTFVAQEYKAVSIVSAGWDPGSDSIVRALSMALVPDGVTYTNFGPGRSMGHTVAAKAIPGIKDALSMTIPVGKGVHRREVYVELMEGANAEHVEALLKSDAYFANDDTQMIIVDSLAAINSLEHGVNLVRDGLSSNVPDQHIEFSMRINNPALTAQMMVSCARATMRLQRESRYGAFTVIEIPPIYFLPGDEQNLINTLV